ncbi:(d)CMP kinase [Aquibacillus salsiterrae]|uniref:Cytidylate kinase n=1 Tax=Aquibacillus salsiterrae TaxID=2950439 RepID=A0A9X3WDF6_9BACI|nr:(d)CMP kinase [Aquibacillus salsiterrae]MDC3415394.1 (d)CMP kinase [Aquibacillus salsiterrae]
MSDKKIAIAIDGPAAAGKSTVAKKTASALSYLYIDTGAMYRSLTYMALNNQIDLDNEDELCNLLNQSTIELQQGEDGQKVFWNNQEITAAIRTKRVTNSVSYVAKHPNVRKQMVKRQKDLAAKRGVVMDGRDIGTHVIPDAEVKIFLIASVEERALRRQKENLEYGIRSNLEQLKQEIEQRDKLDSEREAAPLVKADDAIELDTTSLSINEVVTIILNIVEQAKGE